MSTCTFPGTYALHAGAEKVLAQTYNLDDFQTIVYCERAEAGRKLGGS